MLKSFINVLTGLTSLSVQITAIKKRISYEKY